ncbi:MAG: 3-hydroxyacyl-CoA dehydrogenase family protein, partial [Candidatus Methylomirabilales bacterium]
MTIEVALRTDIKVIGVVGAGTMGHGIAQVALQSGLQVLLHDLEEAILKRAREHIAAGLAKRVRRGKFGEDERQEMLKGLTLTITPSDLSAADFVIEAVTEDLAVKRTLFQHLDRIARPEVILATNTSSLPITKIASTTSRPSQV